MEFSHINVIGPPPQLSDQCELINFSQYNMPLKYRPSEDSKIGILTPCHHERIQMINENWPIGEEGTDELYWSTSSSSDDDQYNYEKNSEAETDDLDHDDKQDTDTDGNDSNTGINEISYSNNKGDEDDDNEEENDNNENNDDDDNNDEDDDDENNDVNNGNDNNNDDNSDSDNTRKTNYTCIIAGFRPIFRYNIHWVHLVC